MIIHSYENSKRADACMKYIRGAEKLKFLESVVLLPIPTTRDNKTILGTKDYICDVFEFAHDTTLVVGYGLPDDVTGEADRLGVPLFDVSRDEEFLSANAELTAVATVGIILNTTELSPSDMSVGIVGYGRIGKRLARLLLYLGAGVRIYTSNPTTRLELCEFGVATSMSTSEADLSGLDILVNTAPAEIFDTSEGGSFPTDLRVIDLASGNNFPNLKDVEKYPSVPARMFPRTAGVEWGKAIERFITGYYPKEGG